MHHTLTLMQCHFVISPVFEHHRSPPPPSPPPLWPPGLRSSEYHFQSLPAEPEAEPSTDTRVPADTSTTRSNDKVRHWKRPGGETGSPLLGQCVMRKKTGTRAPSALSVQLLAAKNLLSTNRKWHFDIFGLQLNTILSVGTSLKYFRRKLLKFEWNKTVSNAGMSHLTWPICAPLLILRVLHITPVQIRGARLTTFMQSRVPCNNNNIYPGNPLALAVFSGALQIIIYKNKN